MSVLVLPIRMPVNQETNPPFTSNDMEINPLFLKCSAIFTIFEVICCKNAFTNVQENSCEKDTFVLLEHRNSVRDLCFRFLPYAGV